MKVSLCQKTTKVSEQEFTEVVGSCFNKGIRQPQGLLFIPEHNTIKHKQSDNYRKAILYISVCLSICAFIRLIAVIHSITKLIKDKAVGLANKPLQPSCCSCDVSESTLQKLLVSFSTFREQFSQK